MSKEGEGGWEIMISNKGEGGLEIMMSKEGEGTLDTCHVSTLDDLWNLLALRVWQQEEKKCRQHFFGALLTAPTLSKDYI